MVTAREVKDSLDAKAKLVQAHRDSKAQEMTAGHDVAIKRFISNR